MSKIIKLAIAMFIATVTILGCADTVPGEEEIECRLNSDCAEGQVCKSAQCVEKDEEKEGLCKDVECSVGQQCIQGRCYHTPSQNECSNDSDCADMEVCTSHGDCFPDPNADDGEEDKPVSKPKPYLKVIRDDSEFSGGSSEFWVAGSRNVPVAQYRLSTEGGKVPAELKAFRLQTSTRQGYNTHALSATEIDQQVSSCQAFDGVGFAVTNAIEPKNGEFMMSFTGGLKVRSNKEVELVVKCNFAPTTKAFKDPYEDLLFDFELTSNSSFVGNLKGQRTKVVAANSTKLRTRGIVRQDVFGKGQVGPFSGKPGEYVKVSEGLLKASGEAIYLRRLDVVNCLNYDADGQCGNDTDERPGDFIFEDVGITFIDEDGIRHGAGMRSVDINHWTLDWRFKIERGEQVRFIVHARVIDEATKGAKGQLTLSPGFAKEGEDFWQDTQVSSSRPRFKARGVVSRKSIFDRIFPSRLPNGNAAHTFTVK